MKPRVICHMTSSIDGRALVPLWHPDDAVPDGLWGHAMSQLDVQGSINGRVTGLEFALGDHYPAHTDRTFPRTDHLLAAGLPDYRVVIDPHGSIAWGRAEVGGAPIVVALLTSVPDSHIAGLRDDGVYYLFVGDTDVDLDLLLDKLGGLGISQLRLGGGPATSGQFLHAGLIDEISLLLIPALDGYSNSPTIIDYHGERDAVPFPVTGITLTSSEILDGGVMWLRYALDNAPQ